MHHDSGKYRATMFALTAVVSMHCMHCQNSITPLVLYVPPVTFTGYFNGDYDSLAGNRSWLNRCELIGDTVRIYCYSTSFSESNTIRHGDLLRIDLLPDSAVWFQKRNTLFHLARYNERNESYTINKGDTIDNTIRFESETLLFSRAPGGTIELEKIYVATPPVVEGQYLEIRDGHLFGSIHRP
jgi:hypothetical protein